MDGMRVVVILSLLAACGRVGFEPGGDALDGGNGSSDAPATIPATGVPISSFGLGAGDARAIDIAAVAIAGGYALGFILDPTSSMYGVHLDPNLAASAALPFQTSPTAGFSTDYTAVSLAWDGTNLVGSLSLNDGTMYLKTFAADMTTFTNADQRTGKIGEPSVARAGTQGVSTWFDGSTLYFTKLMANGVTDGTDRIGGMTPSPIVTTSAASGDVALVVSALADGSCFLHSITAAAPTMGGPLAGPCANPYAVGTGTSFMLAYETSASTFVVRSITASTGSPPVRGPELLSRTGQAPRLFDAGGERLVAFIDATRLQVLRLADSANLVVSGLPAGPPDALEVAGAYLFATYGTTVYAVTPD